MSGRPLLLATLPLLTVVAICLYLRRRGRQDGDPPEPAPPDQQAAQTAAQQAAQPAAQTAAQPAAQPAARQTAQPAARQTAEQPTVETATKQTAEQPAAKQTAKQPTVETAKQPAAKQTVKQPTVETAKRPAAKQTVEQPAAAEPAAPKTTAPQTAEQPAAMPAAKQTAEQPSAEPAEQSAPAAAEPELTAGRDLGQVTAWVRDNIETRRPVAEEPAAERAEAAAVSAAPRGQPEGAQREGSAPEPASGGDALRELEAAVQPAQTAAQDGNDGDAGHHRETPAAKQVPEAVEEAPVTLAKAPVTSTETPLAEKTLVAETQPSEAAAKEPAAIAEKTAVPAAASAEPANGTEPSEPALNGTAEAGGDTASENSSDSGKGGSSTSLEQASPSTSPDSGPLKTTVFDFLIPQKLCGRLIGKNGTFVNMLKARTGAHVIIRLHPVKSSVKICSVDGTQSEVDACLKMIREKFPVNKFPAMTLEQLNRPTEQGLAVPDSQQLHLPQGVTCDVLVSAVVSAGQLFLQQHTHPTFRGLERLTTLMAACYADGSATPELPRPVLASSICAAPVAGGWYRAQVVAFYPDTDELDVRFMDFGGYSRVPAALARQIRTDFMSLPFQAEECYLANVMPVSEDGWSLEAGAVLESLITERALEAMVVGYAEDGTPFVNLYSIQGTEYGNNVISLVNQQLVESGAARWVENQA